MQLNPQLDPEQVTVAFATPVVHLWPHAPQLPVSLVSSTQEPPQKLWPPGHPDTHAAVPPSLPQTGVPASGLHLTPQKPQLEAVSSCTQVLPHSV